MARVLLIVALLAIAFWVYSIVDCAVQSPVRHRGVSKPVWLLIVVLLPVVGGLLWFLVGRLGSATVVVRGAPDDDPDFLSTIGSISDQDERIRRLEEELAQLDAEADDPKPGKGPASPSAAPPPAAPPAAQPRTTGDDDDPRGPRGAVG